MTNVLIKTCNKDSGKLKIRNKELLEQNSLQMINEIKTTEQVKNLLN